MRSSSPSNSSMLPSDSESELSDPVSVVLSSMTWFMLPVHIVHSLSGSEPALV